ncbi:MAG TPA: MFS transporter [Planctomycetaceae bacterium]|nr:MFS transporter [Planctomycetaceae bacterium]
MTKTEWFRRTTWSDADREDFNARLERSRTAFNKAQYLRIQACHLADAGHHAAAIELLDRLFAEFPQRFELAQSHAQKADSLAALGQIDAAIQEYRAALQAERDYSQVRTNAWLDFGWLVVKSQLTDLYEEVSRVMQEFRDERGIKFPNIEYAYNTIQALLADARGDNALAGEFARQALTEAVKDHSGLRYHPRLGLVGRERSTFESRLKAIAGAGATPVQNQDWLVGNPSGVSTAAALWIGSAGLLILGVIPILYGALNDEKRVTLAELGPIATVETLLIGVSSAVAAMLFSARNLRLKCTTLLVALATLDSAISVAGSPNLILIDRALAGLIEGATVAVSIELIARYRHAERLGGLFLAMQALAQGLLALGLAGWVVPRTGANGGFLALGIVCLVSIGVALLVPNEYAEMPKQSASLDGVLTVRSILALLMILVFFMFVVAVWTFLEPLGGKLGIDAQTVGVLVSLGLFVQVAGSLAAAWLEAYLDYRLGILGCGVVGLIAAAILGGNPTLLMFSVAVLAINFVWMFIVPFMIGMTLAADSTRNTCLLVPAAQLLGAAFGPSAATAFVEGEDPSAVPFFGVAMTVASLALFGLFLIAVRRRGAS